VALPSLRRDLKVADGIGTRPAAPPPIASAQAYVGVLAEAFRCAVDKGGPPVERDYAVAGHSLRLRFANAALVPRLTPALAHLSTTHRPPTLEVYLFDSASTGVPLPFPSPEVRAVFEAGEVWLYDDGPRHILFDAGFQTLTMLDEERRLGVFWTPDAMRLSYHETSFPLRQLWRWWLRPHRLQLAHAGAVANERGAVLIAGPSGAGKSTCALACLFSPLDYLGDDFVVLDPEPAPQVHSLYCSAKLQPDNLARLPALHASVTNRERLGDEKALFFVDVCFPQKLRRSAPVRAILFPHVVGTGPTTLEPLSPATALRLLAVSTIFLLHGAGGPDLDALARLLRLRPCYRLVLGAEIADIPVAILGFLESAA
jgi:hypothetical protein